MLRPQIKPNSSHLAEQQTNARTGGEQWRSAQAAFVRLQSNLLLPPNSHPLALALCLSCPFNHQNLRAHLARVGRAISCVCVSRPAIAMQIKLNPSFARHTLRGPSIARPAGLSGYLSSSYWSARKRIEPSNLEPPLVGAARKALTAAPASVFVRACAPVVLKSIPPRRPIQESRVASALALWPHSGGDSTATTTSSGGGGFARAPARPPGSRARRARSFVETAHRHIAARATRVRASAAALCGGWGASARCTRASVWTLCVCAGPRTSRRTNARADRRTGAGGYATLCDLHLNSK